jgi:hypothetical protein
LDGPFGGKGANVNIRHPEVKRESCSTPDAADVPRAERQEVAS